MENLKVDYLENANLHEMIMDSDHWIVIRMKKGKDIHCHFKDEYSIGLIAMLLADQPEMWDAIKKTVWDLKKKK
jgi:hypothetical protein